MACTTAIKSEPIKSLMENKMLKYHIHFCPNEGMYEDGLKCHNFIAVTLGLHHRPSSVTSTRRQCFLWTRNSVFLFAV